VSSAPVSTSLGIFRAGALTTRLVA
jgi:hypothetical protein